MELNDYNGFEDHCKGNEIVSRLRKKKYIPVNFLSVCLSVTNSQFYSFY